MPRSLSEDTKSIYLWLWRLPWAAGADIARITGLKQNKVSNALKRGERRGWLRSARLGRVFKAVDRFVFSNAGIEEMGRQFGWEPSWWHTANGVRALARRLEVLELAYRGTCPGSGSRTRSPGPSFGCTRTCSPTRTPASRTEGNRNW